MRPLIRRGNGNLAAHCTRLLPGMDTPALPCVDKGAYTFAGRLRLDRAVGRQNKKGVKELIGELRRRNVVRGALIYAAVAWAVTEVMGTVLPALYAPDWVFTVVVLAFLVGFPVSMFLAWVFDISGAGIRKADAHGIRGWLSISIAAALMLGGTAGLFFLIYPHDKVTIGEEIFPDAPATASNTVAVLPFADMTMQGDHAWLADGIAETLIHNLAQYRQLRVTARTSAFSFKGRNLDVRQIGHELGVAAILEGSVQRAGDTLRVTAQLVDASDGVHIWSQVFDRPAVDLFDVQDEICARVAAAMLRTLTGEGNDLPGPRYSTRNLDAYDLYLLGRHEFHQRTPESLARASELLGEAVNLDPEYSLALLGLADTYIFMTYYSGLEVDKAANLAAPLIEKARLASPSLAEAHASQGLLWHRLGRYKDAEQALRTAAELNPNYANAWIWLGLNFVQLGRPIDALDAYENALGLDPLHGVLNRNVGAILMLMGKPQDAMKHFETVIRHEPELKRTYGMVAHWQHVYGHLDSAILWAKRDLESGQDPTFALQVLARVYADLGLWESADSYLDRLKRESGDEAAVAMVTTELMLQRGDTQAFIDFATRAYREQQGFAKSGVYTPLESQKVRDYALAELLAGRAEQCRNVLERFSGGPSGLLKTRYDDVGWLIHLATCYRMLGDELGAQRVLRQSLDLILAAKESGWATPTLHLRHARILAMRGETEEALRVLQIAFELGARSPQALKDDPALASLREDERFIALLERMSADLLRQRKLVHSST